MRSTLPLVMVVVGGLMIGTPDTASSQSPESSSSDSKASADTEGDTNDNAEETDASGSDDTSSKTSSSDEESSSPSDSGDSEQASDGTSTDSDEGSQSGRDSVSSDTDAKGEATASQQGSGKTGPGGRKMREDYPGNEKAMKSKMKTDRIEGLNFQEGQDPSQAYDMQIKELETKIDDLKEDVFQSKSRILSLKERVLGGNLSGSRAIVVHTKGLGPRFKLKRALYSLDGSRVYNESAETGAISEKEEIKVFDGSLTPGGHNVAILLEYQGSGLGLFNYMRDYSIQITSSCQFQAESGKATTLRVTPVTRGPAFSKKSKAEVECKIKKTDLSQTMERQGSSKKGQRSKSNNRRRNRRRNKKSKTNSSSSSNTSGGGS